MVGGLVHAVMLINSTEMIVELFDAYAPSLKIGEVNLGTTKKQRMEILFGRLEKLAEENPAEHSALFKILNTIATLNTDNSNDKVIRDFLADHLALRKVYDSLRYAGMFNGRSTLAMLASFVAIRAKIGEEDKEDAQSLWSALQVSASKAAQGNFLHKNITPPTLTPAQSALGLQTFRDELEKYIRLTNQQKNYIAFVIPSKSSDGFIRYYVNTSPPERDVPKVEDGKRVIGPDTNMTGFEIRHFYARDKVWISETKSGDQEYILDLFLRHVLGSQVEKQKRRHCEHRLPVFKDPKKFAEQITMPKKSAESGEKVWISELEIQVADEVSGDNFKLQSEGEDVYLPTVFKGTDILPVHEQIEKLLKERFTRNNWKVLRVELKAKLHPNAYNENQDWVGETTDFTEVTFPIKPGGCTPRIDGKHKNDRELRLKALSLRARWRLDGVTDEAYNLMSQAERDGEV